MSMGVGGNGREPGRGEQADRLNVELEKGTRSVMLSEPRKRSNARGTPWCGKWASLWVASKLAFLANVGAG